MPKTYHVSVYGEVEGKKRQHVKSHWRAGSKVRGYYRTVTVWEQRRWDLKGTKADLKKAITYIKRKRAAPKVRHKRISARTFLSNPEKWISGFMLEAPEARSPFCPICNRRLRLTKGRLRCPVHGVIY
jgi:hypothetical protein